jgi:hypothetical protein
MQAGPDGLPDVLHLQAWMLFPRDASTRHALLARRRLSQAVREAGHTTTTLVAIEDVQRALTASIGPELDRQCVDAVKEGSIAGMILRIIYESHQRGAEEPSFQKALLACRQFAPGKRYGDNKPLRYAPMSIRRAWAAYEPVAHLWAALEFTKQGAPQPSGMQFEPDTFQDPTKRVRLLGMARAIGDFATTFVPKRKKPPEPLISPQSLVRIPSHITPIQLSFRPL